MENLVGRASARTDLFINPASGEAVMNAPMELFDAGAGDFLLSAEVEVEFRSTFDAGVLVLWSDETHWAKLCFEYSPQGEAMVVSVVTNGISDDANGPVPAGPRVHLRVGRRGRTGVMHYSEDGAWWRLVRVFRLPDGPLKAGFEVQSPTGEGVVARFGKIAFRRVTLQDPRNGE